MANPEPSQMISGPLDVTHLQQLAQIYYHKGLAPSTKNTYSAGQHKFISFCKSARLTPVPASESTLLLFAAYLANMNISYATIKIYLSAIRHMHVTAGMHSFFNLQLTPRLQLILKGIQKSQSVTHPPRVRLPITIGIMKGIMHLISQKPKTYNNSMMWAACCLAFFGFLRVSEFTIPSYTQFDEEVHLCLDDISVDCRDNPQALRLRLKQSKTDPFRRGVSIYLGTTENNLCPVKGILPYLAMRGSRAGPLFIYSDGRGLTRPLFKAALDDLLTDLHLDKKQYNTHSFRIGAAASAKQANIPDTYIKMLGRWRSDAYQCYIKTPPQDLARFSKQLITGYSSASVGQNKALHS